MDELHSLLRRQLKRHLGSEIPDTPAWRNFSRAVSDAYREFDTQRELSERSLVLSSAELHQANAQMRAIFQAIPDLLFRLDQRGTILDFQAGTADDLVRPARELIGKLFFNLPSREGGKRFKEAIQRIAENKLPAAIEYSLALRGQENFYEARLVPLPMEQIIVIIRNVTGRKRAEAELFQSRQMLRTVLDTIPTRIFWKDRNSVYLGCNQPLALDCGYSNPAEIIGKTDFDTVSAANAELYRADDRRVMETRVPKLNYEEPQITASGGQRWLLSSKAPLYDKDGRVIGVLGTYEDITEYKSLEEQLRQAQKMEAVGQLSGGIAHDFNNLLTIIQGHVSLMELEADFKSEFGNSITAIRQAAGRAASLTRQLLAFSRRQPMHTNTLDLNEAVSHVLQMLDRIVGEEIVMQIHCAAEPTMIHADASMIEQILMNLVVNSRDAMPRGGRLTIETANVKIDAEAASKSPQARPGNFVRLSVTDTGIGIPPEVMPKIFEPFFTTKGVGKGTGLGLATVYGIVQQHRGWIEVSSEAGKGAAFHVYLPQSEKVPLRESAPKLPSARGGNETILLVEDEPAVRVLVSKILSRLGYRIIEAANGVEALEIWKQRRDEIQLLFTDMVMPRGVSGAELSKELCRDNPKLKVIYASGYSADVVSPDFELEEGVNFIGKPFDPARLARIVRARLDA